MLPPPLLEAPTSESNLTSGTLLGGRIRYDQPAEGYRTGFEPVLLAASVPARPGDSVLEAGCGAGAGLLCLATRVPGITGLGLERDPAMVALARDNFAANDCSFLTADLTDVESWRGAQLFDHAFANPPWFDARTTMSPVASRRSAKHTRPGQLAAWVASLARALRPRGSLSLILPSASLPEAMATLSAAKCGGLTVVPLWPRANGPAKLFIVQGIRLGRGAARLMPGLVLHAGTQLTEAAQGVLRDGRDLCP